MKIQTTQLSPRILVALAFCMALQMTSFVMILPLFARRFDSFGAGVEALGVSAIAYALTSTIAAPFIGMLADRFGRRPIILLSLAAYDLAISGYLFAASAWQLITLRGLAGVFTAGLLPAMMSIVGDLAPENRRAQWIGIVNGGASAGWILGPLFGGAVYALCKSTGCVPDCHYPGIDAHTCFRVGLAPPGKYRSYPSFFKCRR